jgi:hypothetical protein
MAAGLGFKDFTTGEVLTAADVDGYLMQGIWVFANAAARDAAVTSPQEGNCCYLKDTDAVQTYSGSAWVGFDDSNAIQNSIVDAKGDIVAASGNDTPARLAVGANGTTIVADNSTSTGLSYIPTFFAGKNKIINGDFNINQRAFSSVTANGTYTFDRFVTNFSGGTVTFTPQTFTPGAAPVSGYEATNFLQIVTSGQSASDYASIGQKIENVRTFAGQTVTLSFWAKATSGTPKIGWYALQNFGSGGSSAAAAYAGYTENLSSSWARYSITYAVPSISGKTIGTSSSFDNYLMVSDGAGTQGIQNNTFQIWGVQVEAGSTATSFQTATGTIQGELAACYRYFQRITDSSGGVDGYIATSIAFGSTAAYGVMQFIAPFRSNPTTTLTSGNFEVLQGNGGINSLSSMTFTNPTTTTQLIGGTTTGLTSGQALLMRTGSTAFVLDISAEL